MLADRVLMTDNVFASLDEFHAELKPLGLKLELSPASDEATLVQQARNAAAIIVVYAKITDPVISAAASAGCRVISRCGIGYDNIDIESATRHRVQVTYVPDYCLDEVADHTMALLLAFARGLVPSALATRNGGWTAPRELMRRLHGRTLALVGVGRIGRRVAARARAFGLTVIAFDPYVKEWDLNGVTRADSLAAALGAADFVSLHAPLTADNHHLIGVETLKLMRQKPLLINTARGGLIDLDAVTDALNRGDLSGVALDVFEFEPLSHNHELRTNPLAVITPHTAYYSIESELELKRKAAEEVTRALRGEPPRCPVNHMESTHLG